MEILKEFIKFAITRKKIWLLPLLIIFALISGIIFVTQGTAISPFIYTIF